MSLTAAAQRRLRARARAAKDSDGGDGTLCDTVRAVPAADGDGDGDGAPPCGEGRRTLVWPRSKRAAHQPRRRPSGPMPPVSVVTLDRKVSFGEASSVLLADPATAPPSDVNDVIGRCRPARRPRRSRSCLRATPRWAAGCGGAGPAHEDEDRQYTVDELCCCEAAECVVSNCNWIVDRLSKASWKGDMTTLEDLLFSVDAEKTQPDDKTTMDPEERLALEEIEVVHLRSEGLRSAPPSPSAPVRKCRSAPLAALRREMENAGFREVPP